MGTSSASSTITAGTTPTITLTVLQAPAQPAIVPAPTLIPRMGAGATTADPRGTKRKREEIGSDEPASEPVLKIARHETVREQQVQALFSAIEQGNDQKVAELLKQSPELSRAVSPEPHGTTPLCEAARHGHTKIASLLLGAGVPVDEPANNGSTPLMFAAQQGHIDLIRWLCAHGADPNRLNELALKTPLVFAIESKNFAASQALISVGADPQQEIAWVDLNSGQRKSQTPLTTAMCLDFVELIAWLLDTRRLAPHAVDRLTNISLLNAAAYYGAASIVEMLAERGANLDRGVKLTGGTFNSTAAFAEGIQQFGVLERIFRSLKTSKETELLKLSDQLHHFVAIDLLLHVDLWMNPKGHAADGLRDPVLRSRPEKVLEQMAECRLIYQDKQTRIQWHSARGWLCFLGLSKLLIEQGVACASILGNKSFRRSSSAGTMPQKAEPTTAQLLQMLVEMVSISTGIHAPFSGVKLSAQTRQVMSQMFDLQLQLLLSGIKHHRMEFERRMQTLPDICINTFISLSHSLNKPDLYRKLTKEWGLYDPVARAVIRLVGKAYKRLRSLPQHQMPAAFAAMPPAEQLRHVMIDLLEQWDKIPEIAEALRKGNSTKELDLLEDLLFQQWRLFGEAFGVMKPHYSPFAPRRPEVAEAALQRDVDIEPVANKPAAPVSLALQ